MVAVLRDLIGRWACFAFALVPLVSLGFPGEIHGAVPPPLDSRAGGVIRHRLEARIEPSRGAIQVTDTLTIRHRSGVSASTPFPLMLAKSLSVKEVAGLEGRSVGFREDRLRPRDYWSQPPYDELAGYERARSILLEYRGAGEAWPESLRVVIRYEGGIYDTLRPPQSAYARGFEETSGLIDPRGAYLCGGSFWLPGRPDERFTFRAALSVPSEWRAVSQGDLWETRVRDGGRTDIWDCPQLMEEVYFIAGPYTLRSETRRAVEVMTYTYELTDDQLCMRYIEGTERYLKLYGELIGPYPFGKFALVENFWQTGFGMPSFTLLGDQVIRLPFILDTSYGHEILHNWWGNGVFVDYQGGNWCEGLTTYGADYLYKERQSPEEAREYRRATLQGYLDYVSEGEDIPLRSFRQRSDFSTQAIGYGKSMMVFHQLRRMLGDQRFTESLQEFYREFLFRRASWDDLFTVFGRVAGRDLAEHKAQWLDRTGAPVLRIEECKVAAASGGGFATTVTVLQTQEPPYAIEVPVRVGWNGVDAESSAVLPFAAAAASVVLHTAKRPDWVAVDPGFDVLRRIDPREIPPALSRTLGADTAVVVIAAGLPPDLASAYESLAKQWDEGARLGILHEESIAPETVLGVPHWLFGAGPLALKRVVDLPKTTLAEGLRWIVDGIEYPAGSGIVLAGGPPGEPRHAFAMLVGNSPGQISGIGRKVPHYGKYGYLIFQETTNVAKGAWPIAESPLRVDLQEE